MNLISPSTHARMRWGAALAATALMIYVLVAGAQPGATAWMPPGWDKVVHAAYHALLAALWLVALGLPRRGWVLLICVAYGALDEYLQSSLPGRVASLGDLAADAVGAALVVGLAPRVWQAWLAPRLQRAAG